MAGVKLGALAVYLCKHQTKIHQCFILAYNKHGNPLASQTAKFKSANIFSMEIWGLTAKCNSCQYFQLYGSVKYRLSAGVNYYLSKRSKQDVLRATRPLCRRGDEPIEPKKVTFDPQFTSRS